METPLTDTALATVMSFLVAGSDRTEMDKLKAIDPKIKNAIDKNLSEFTKEILLEIDCEDGHPLEHWKGLWDLVFEKRTPEKHVIKTDEAFVVSRQLHFARPAETFLMDRRPPVVLILDYASCFSWDHASKEQKESHIFKMVASSVLRFPADNPNLANAWFRGSFPACEIEILTVQDELTGRPHSMGLLAESCERTDRSTLPTPYNEGQWYDMNSYLTPKPFSEMSPEESSVNASVMREIRDTPTECGVPGCCGSRDHNRQLMARLHKKYQLLSGLTRWKSMRSDGTDFDSGC